MQRDGSSSSGSHLSLKVSVAANEHSNMAHSSRAPPAVECNTKWGMHMPEGGWFAKCRGCGWMTVHEQEFMSYQVPVCKRCQYDIAHLKSISVIMHKLVFIHIKWAAIGL
jgi:hypothetical protein